jgi:hypothetical protein
MSNMDHITIGVNSDGSQQFELTGDFSGRVPSGFKLGPLSVTNFAISKSAAGLQIDFDYRLSFLFVRISRHNRLTYNPDTGALKDVA